MTFVFACFSVGLLPEMGVTRGGNHGEQHREFLFLFWGVGGGLGGGEGVPGV